MISSMIAPTRWALALWSVAALTGCGAAETAEARLQRSDAMITPPTAVADSAAQDPPERLPDGWTIRLDRAVADPAEFRVTQEADGFAIRTGPHGILYDRENRASRDDYDVRARFTELASPPGHREGYGLFFGGTRLEGRDQAYSYFLVRGDGRYLIKLRTGTETVDVSDGWMVHDAINVAKDGTATNVLLVRRTDGFVYFAINDVEVAMLPDMLMYAAGIAGIRVAHDLNLRVEGWAFGR
jgi:hypothetical protein